MINKRVTPANALIHYHFTRAATKLTEKEIAEFLGVNERMVEAVRSGEIFPHFDLLKPLARLLRIEPIYLFNFWARDYARPLFEFIAEQYGEYLTEEELLLLEELDRIGESDGATRLWTMHDIVERMLQFRKDYRV